MSSPNKIADDSSLIQLNLFLKAYNISTTVKTAFNAVLNASIGGVAFTRECEVAVIHPGQLIIRDQLDLSLLCEFDAGKEPFLFSPEAGLKIKSVIEKDGSPLKFDVIVTPETADKRLILSQVERMILERLAAGELYQQIADDLDISFYDVVIHVKKIFHRIDSRIVAEEVMN